MRAFSMTVALLTALALAGCSEGVKEVKGEKGDAGEKGEPGAAGRPARRAAKAIEATRAMRGLPARRSGLFLRNHRPPHASPTRS
jgi:hypothetical protein